MNRPSLMPRARALLAAVWLLGTAIPAAAQSASPDALRAAIIYNIVRFVDFGAAGASPTLDICAAHGAGGLRELAALAGRRAGERTITVRAINPDEGTAGCEVVYLGDAGAPAPAPMRTRGALVIGNGPDFLARGGTIALVRMGAQIRFEINLRAARAAGLPISAQLLRLAARVQQ